MHAAHELHGPGPVIVMDPMHGHVSNGRSGFDSETWKLLLAQRALAGLSMAKPRPPQTQHQVTLDIVIKLVCMCDPGSHIS